MPPHNLTDSPAASGIYGLAVGDALGVPVEFQSREELHDTPVIGMRAYGTHEQPAGTWSDDTSLALCLAESLSRAGIDYEDQAGRFVSWHQHATWTPHGVVFDIGNATRAAIYRLASGVNPTEAGSTHENSNGNGSLMRILPLAIYLAYAESQVRIDEAMSCSRLTHGHPRCQIACALFTEIAAALVRGVDIVPAIAEATKATECIAVSRFPNERPHFTRILDGNIPILPESQISGSGYVIHCLEASLWCLLRGNSYSECVLAAVNLGDDADTTGAVTGGLAGLRFGFDAIPLTWRDGLARTSDIAGLCEQFQRSCEHRWGQDLTGETNA